MQWFARAMLCAAIPLLSACQTEQRPSQSIITATRDVVYIDATCASGKAIFISRGDVLTLETAEMIGDHNNELFCRCPEKRPAAFDASICKV